MESLGDLGCRGFKKLNLNRVVNESLLQKFVNLRVLELVACDITNQDLLCRTNEKFIFVCLARVYILFTSTFSCPRRIYNW